MRAVVPPDHQVGALALTDLVADDRLDDALVVGVGGGEAAAVGELERHVGQGVEQVVDGDLVLDVDVDDGQRRAVVERLEAALADLAERHRDEAVRATAGLWRSVGERDVEEEAISCGVPPRRPAVGAALRRMIAHAPWPRISSRRARTSGWAVMGEP